MADNDTLSPQDLQDLQEVYKQLPNGHPKKAALGLLISSQPTQFEKDRTPGPDSGFVSHATNALKGVASGLANIPLSPSDLISNTIKQGGQMGADMAARQQEGRSKAYQVAAPLAQAVVPGLNPRAMEQAANQGDTGGVLGEAAVPTALALAPYGAKLAGAAREGIGGLTHDATGAMTPGARAAGKVLGVVGGGAYGALKGSPYAAGAGATAGYTLGPSLMEAMFPEPKAAIAARSQFANTQMMTEAQEAALKQNGVFDRSAAKNTPPPSPFGNATATDPADALFQKNFGPEYKQAGDLAEWETGSREGGPITGAWKATTDANVQAQGLNRSFGHAADAINPDTTRSRGDIAANPFSTPSGQTQQGANPDYWNPQVRTPEGFQEADFREASNAQLARQRGMEHAARGGTSKGKLQ